MISWPRVYKAAVARYDSVMGRAGRALGGWIPHASKLGDREWEIRHRGIIILLWLHGMALPIFGLYRGVSASYSLGAGALIAAVAVMSGWRRFGHRVRSVLASGGLLMCSSILVKLSGGYIEAHFHFFVMAAIIAMYEDVILYLYVVLFVAIEHGLVGHVEPAAVYNHADALAHPWKWALIHAGFILCMCVAMQAWWRANQRVRARNELVLNSAGEGLLGVDLNGMITFANTAAAAMTGYSLAALVGRALNQIVTDPSDTVPTCQFDPALMTLDGRICRCIDKVIMRGDGTTLFPVDVVCNPVTEGGVNVGTVVTLKDETYRRQAQQALHENEERLRQMAENIEEVFWMSNPGKNRMIYISPAYETIWGRSCADLYKHPTSWMEAVHHEDRGRIRRAALEKQVRGEYDEEYRIVRGDGAIRWIRDRAFPIRNERGEIYRIAGVAADITAYKEAEKAINDANTSLVQLNASLERRVAERTAELEALIHQVSYEKQKTDKIIHEINDGVVMTDEAGRIILLNPAARMHLLGKQRVNDKSVFNDVAYYPHLREIFENPIEIVTREVEIRDSDHDVPRVFKATAVPLMDDKGDFLGKVAIFHDITRYKEVDRLKSEFISQVSHELRTPLTSIKGYIDNLRDGVAGALSVQQSDYVQRMSKNADHLAHLINDLLDVSRIESGKMTLSLGLVCMEAMVGDVVDRLRPMALAKGQTIEWTTPAQETHIRGDSGRLEQVVTNLLDNAVKFTPRDGMITVQLVRDARSVTVSVRDTGIGVAPHMQSHIFERFYRLQRRGRSFATGAGLGLYIAKTIVELHGGTIWVDSESGKGSVFSFTLPSGGGIAIQAEAIENSS